MNDEVVFEIGDLYNNAGLVGLYKLLCTLDKEEKHYKVYDDKIVVQKDFLLEIDLTKASFNTFIDNFYNDLTFTKALNIINIILEKIDKNSSADDINDDLKQLKNWLTVGNRFKTGYEIISQKVIDSYNIFDKIKKIVAKKDMNKTKNDLIHINEYLNVPEVKEIMLMKDIAYTIINNFWNDKSFLLRTNAKKDMYEVHYKTFEEPLKNHLNRQKPGKNYCSNCGEDTKDALTYTFITGMGDDFARKNSVFWNFKQDKCICPKCQFIYSLIPLGFRKNGYDFIFINNNNSVDALIHMNDLKITEETTNLKNYQIYNEIISNYLVANENKLDNIEVANIYANKESLELDIINKGQLNLIKQSRAPLKFLADSYDVRINGNYLNLYQEVVEDILKNDSIYKTLYKVIETSVKEKNNYLVRLMKPILDIQNTKESISRKEKGMKENKDYYFAGKEGARIYKKVMASGQDENYIIGITYKLLNALRRENINDYLDIIIRLCNSLKCEVPTCFINNMNDKEKFESVGYAFLVGLRGGIYEKNDDKDGGKDE